MKPTWLLFTAIGAGPLAWFLSLEVNFALAPLACSQSAKTALYIVLLFAFLGAASGLALGAGALRSQPAGVTDPGISTGRYRAMALAGVVLSALALLAIIAQTIPTVLFAGCE
ncbi:MAG TPA: hypothetical protein VHC90_15800 [Bryobacteraceae bacterium]|nr:hypothetical protein [Bryobacteraceae bacterium]